MASQSRLKSLKKQQSEAYLRYYQLERDPFSDQGISGLFFPGGERKKAVDTLLHFSRYGSAPLFLSAADGYGKTTILNEFARSVEADVDVVIVTVEMLLSEQQMLDQILQAFGLMHQPGTEDWVQLGEWAAEQSARDRHVVFCIDNVEHLEKEFVANLLKLAVDTEPGCKIIFAGEPDAGLLLETTVEQQGLMLNSLALCAFTRQHVAEYVAYRLRAAGYRGDFPLSDMQLQAAAMRSRGSISQLNNVLRDMLIAGIDPEKAATSPRFPASNLILAAALAGVTLYFGWQGLDRRAEPVVGPITLEAVDSLPETASVKDSHQSHDTEAVATEPVREVSLESTSLAGENSQAVSENKVESTGSALAEMSASVAIASTAGSVRPGTDEQIVVSSVEQQVALQQDTVRRGQPGTNSQNKEAVKAVSPVHQRLQTWPDLGYALQVFGTHNAQRARKLVEQYYGETDLLFYETRHNGKPWYVVINGPYTGRQAAQENIRQLPDGLQRLRPWPRNIASIKSDIERYKVMLDVESN